jgi:Na+/melibiose symporter-like transporter
VVLLILFVIWETRVGNPLLPMRILLDRTRGGAYLSSTLIGAGFIGAIFFVSLYFQNVLHYSPLQAGLATLPLSGGVLFAAAVASGLLPRLGAKPIMSVGAILAAGGMVYLTQIGVDTSYVTHVLLAEIILGVGLGCTFVPLGNIALVGVSEHDAGAASAVVNASQQVGGSLGTALLNTVAISAASAYLPKHAAIDGPLAAVHAQVSSYVHAYAWGSGLLILAAIVVLVFIDARTSDLPTDGQAVPIG